VIVMPQISVTADRVVFGDGDAVSIARTLVAQGARAVQVRDVDGRLAAAPGQATWLGELVDQAEVPVQLDAALFDPSAIERVARIGLATIVVAQVAAFDPALLRWAMDLLGHRLVVELQVDGQYLFDPPRAGYALELIEAARRLKFQGVRHVLFRDVTGVELPLQRLRELTVDVGMGVTFAGLVRSLDDLRELTVIDSSNLLAVVVGEPIYDGRIRLADANVLFAR
jgi:phosphoribosylformimino-5-aminoimidazole carboxamide ribonucleotide (ProFAR) isomerase